MNYKYILDLRTGIWVNSKGRVAKNIMSLYGGSKEKGPPYTCQYCGQIFNEIMAIARHERQHRRNNDTKINNENKINENKMTKILEQNKNYEDNEIKSAIEANEIATTETITTTETVTTDEEAYSDFAKQEEPSLESVLIDKDNNNCDKCKCIPKDSGLAYLHLNELMAYENGEPIQPPKT